MSYCRFSTDNFQCDVYCYEGKDGWVIHTASKRLVGAAPGVPNVLSVSIEEFMRAYRAQMDFMQTCERSKIESDLAGETFVHGNLEDTIERLQTLRAAGFRFPDSVLEDLQEELNDERAAEEQRNRGPDHENA